MIKYLAFLSVNFLKVCTVHRLCLSNSIYSKNYIKEKYYFLTLKKIFSIEFLENKELQGSSRYLHLRKFQNIFTKGNLKNCRIAGKIHKEALYFQLVVINLAGEFREH